MKMTSSLYRIGFVLSLMVALYSCVKKEQEVAVRADFSFSYAAQNQTIPVRVSLTNNSTGADRYQWTFEGGSPATSSARNPGTIVYEKAGLYNIILEASNQDVKDKKIITIQIDSAVLIDFTIDSIINTFAPAEIMVNNKSLGGSSYQWTFEGGNPSTSAAQHPGKVSYAQPGTYTISLIVSNGSKTFQKEKTLTVAPALQADFNISPFFGDEDYEAPFQATLKATGQSILHYSWSAPGATIKDPKAAETSMLFKEPGTYTISLQADNNKETKLITRTITVLKNSNLYSLNGIKLGINTAHKNWGSFYSTRLRQVIKAGEVNASNGKLIDIAFFGLNEAFTRNLFISADRVADYTFDAIPQARTTRWINNLHAQGIDMNNVLFEQMQDDQWLQKITVGQGEPTPIYFNNTTVPYFVMFQHESGYKGLIRIREFHQGGTTGSYILMDVKVQKN